MTSSMRSFPNEQLDDEWLSRQWFLIRAVRFKQGGGILHLRPENALLKHHWKPLLTIALAQKGTFAVPIELEIEPGWRLEKMRYAHPLVDIVGTGPEPDDCEERPYDTFVIPPEGGFLDFVRLCNMAIARVNQGSASWLRTAASRFLRATFSSFPFEPFPEDEAHEHALLQYIFALEALTKLPGDRDALTHKTATRAALLAGIDDERRMEIHTLIKSACDERGAVVHSGSSKERTALHELREVVRRVFVVLLASLAADEGVTQGTIVTTIELSGAQREKVRTAGTRAFGLLDS